VGRLAEKGVVGSGRQSATGLSVILPMRNEGAVVAATLDALKPLRDRGCELIAVDGGSSDSTVELARPRVDQLLQTAPGRARQMNHGAASASGRVLLFLHADTLLPAAADRLLFDGMAASCRRWGRFDLRLSGSSPAFRLIERMINLRSRLVGIATGDQAIFVERELFLALGGYAEIPLMEDIDLSRRLRATGRPLCITNPLTTSSRRWEEGGIVATVLRMWAVRLAYWSGVPAERLARYYRHR
jgi:rSAM/selenodomain-associated transferase 2